MSFLKFDKMELVNLEYSLSREVIRSNRAGSYASTTIIGCNTRKYHGLLVCPIDEADGDNHVLLSTLDATVIQHNQEFNLGIHKYEGDLYVPRGHKYIRDFDAETVSRITYRVGGVVLSRESVLVENEDQILLKYTLEDAHSETTLRFRPFLAFRNFHALSKANMYVNTRYETVPNGISSKLYSGYPALYMQFSKEVDFVPVPDWYYNIEYAEEQSRGYDFKEDLYVPGYFEVPIAKGETIIFSASVKEAIPSGLKRRFTSEHNKRIPKDSYHNCLVNAAQQFLRYRNNKTEIIAGFPWFGSWGRDTFISLPGLTMTTGDLKNARAVIDTMIGKMKGGLFPNMGSDERPAFNSVDAPMWFIWSLQQYEKYVPETDIWKEFGDAIKDVLNSYRNGTVFNIRMLDNGLIYAGADGKALTWMDAVVYGQPVTQRKGSPVEVNALWYNAICQSLKWAEDKDKTFVKGWKHLPEQISKAFIDKYWDQEKGYLADYFDGEYRDFAVRPNMAIATAMEFTPLTMEMKKSILDVTEKELLTPRGLRTLSPKNPMYEGFYSGSQEERDRAYHQGTVWPWLLEHFVKGYFDVYKKSALPLVTRLFEGFEGDLSLYGVGAIGEIYDGNPPHMPRGSISQAWSVASLLRIEEMIGFYRKQK